MYMQHAEHALRLLPNGGCTVIPNVGHFGTIEETSELVSLVVEFFHKHAR